MGWQNSDRYVNPLEWAAKMKDVPREAINAFAFSVFNRVVVKTPVDTGQARSNWLVSINEDDDRKLGADVKYKKIKRSKGKNTGKVEIKRSVKLERSATKTKEQGRMAIAFAQGDDKIIIQNNLPYIRKLEYGGFTDKPETEKTIGGFSKQAPQGMVGLTLTNADRLWERAVKAVAGNT